MHVLAMLALANDSNACLFRGTHCSISGRPVRAQFLGSQLCPVVHVSNWSNGDQFRDLRAKKMAAVDWTATMNRTRREASLGELADKGGQLRLRHLVAHPFE
jgi:hypothetical protein